MNLPKLRQLEYFIAVIDHGSFNAAAQACFVTQSTLSAGIKDLENIFAQTLIDRSIKAITLTPFGQSIEDNCRQLINDATIISAMARDARDPLSGIFRLGIIPTIAPYALPKLLPTLQKSLPKLDLQIHEDLSERLVEKLNHGLLDCVLMAFPYPLNGAQSRALMDEPFFLAKAKTPQKALSRIKISSLNTDDIILLDDGHCLRDHALKACALSPKQNNRSFSASSLPTLIEMVKNGHGQTVLPQMAITKDMHKSLDIIAFTKPTPTREIGVAWRKNTASDTLIDILCDLITTKFLQDL